MARREAFRSGFVALVGRPNVGKSTLLNALLGRKVAIVTPHPQTTRTHLLGILEVPATDRHPAAQIVMIDSPGIHKARTPLNREMLRHVRAALEGRDMAVLMVDVTRPLGAEDEFAMQFLAPLPLQAPGVPSNTAPSGAAAVISAGSPSPPTLLVLNKVDRLRDKRALLPLIAEYQRRLPVAAMLPLSARTGEGLPALVDEIVAHLPAGPKYFPQGALTDQSERFQAAEIVREKAMLATREELPHALAVAVETYELTPKPCIAAVLFCERPGQKAILIGRRGEMMKRIGTEARAELQAALADRLGGRNLFLQLRVEVRPGWRGDAAFLRQMDWRHAEETAQTTANLLTEQ